MSLKRTLVDRLCRAAGDRGESVTMYDRLGYFPNLLWPRSFNEKVVRRKLRPTPPIWSEYADKLAVRAHVARRVGDEYLNRLYLVAEDAESVRTAALPQRFIAKATHGSGWSTIWTGDGRLREEELQRRCRRWLEQTFGVATHERWYSAIPPAIIVEELLQDATYGEPLDYKLWVFHGRVEWIQVDFDRRTQHRRSFYDRDWVRQPWTKNHEHGPDLERPPLLGGMIEVAEALAVDPEFVRVDLYCPDQRYIRFGELTFAPDAGWGPFLPSKTYDFEVGKLW